MFNSFDRPWFVFDKWTVGQQLLGTSCWYRDNCITKLWALSSYFLYLYMVFIQHCFHPEQHCFRLDRQFSCSSNISNWLSWIPTQSSIVIQNSCSSWLSCTLSGSNRCFKYLGICIGLFWGRGFLTGHCSVNLIFFNICDGIFKTVFYANEIITGSIEN